MFCRECGKEVRTGSEACLSCGVRPLDGANYCQECGAKTKTKQLMCVKCGMKLLHLDENEKSQDGFALEKIMPSDPPKDPVIAFVLSLIIIGMGQVYLGQVAKGLVLLACAIFLGFATFGVAAVIIYVISAVDVYKIGQKLKSGTSIGQWEFF